MAWRIHLTELKALRGKKMEVYSGSGKAESAAKNALSRGKRLRKLEYQDCVFNGIEIDIFDILPCSRRHSQNTEEAMEKAQRVRWVRNTCTNIKYRTQIQNTNTEHKTQNTFRWPPDGSRDLNSNCLPSGNVSTLVDLNKNQRKVTFLMLH